MNSKFKALIKATEPQTCALGNHSNRRNAPKPHHPPNKPPNQPKLSTKYDSIMQNKANFPAVSKTPKMNITSATTVNYINELRTTNYELIMQNKPNSNPIYRGGASGEGGTNPTCRGGASGEAGSEPKKCCSPPLCCGISKEKMIFCNRLK